MCVWDRSTGHVNICSPLLSVSFCSFRCLAEMLVMLSDYHVLFGGEKEEAVLGRIQRASAFQIAVPLFNCKVCHSCLQGIFQSDIPQCPFPLSASHWQEQWEPGGQPWLLCNCSAGESFPLFLPTQGQLRARCAHAQSPECPLLFPLCRSSSVAVCSEPCSRDTVYSLLSSSCSPPPALHLLLSSPCSPSPSFYLLLFSSCSPAPHRQLGARCACKWRAEWFNSAREGLGTRPTSSLSNCNFSPLKSGDMAACQKQGGSWLWA